MELGATPMTAFLILVCLSALLRGQLSALVVSSPLSILNQLKLCGFCRRGWWLETELLLQELPPGRGDRQARGCEALQRAWQHSRLLGQESLP